MPPADNSRFLIEASRRRHLEARERTELAIERASKSTERITMMGIARAAGVSKSWLYTQEDLVSAIEPLRRRPSPTTGREPASDGSLRVRLETAQARNRSLREELTEVSRRLEVALGEIRRLRTVTDAQVAAGSLSTPSSTIHTSGTSEMDMSTTQ